MRLTERLALALALTLFLSGCGNSWSEADRENAAHFFRAFEYANNAVKLSNSAESFSVVTQEETQQELGLIERALREAEQIDDVFLDQRHNGLRSAFRVLFQKSLQLRIEGLRNADAKSLNQAVLLYGEWIDWFEDHKREMELPRPSKVLGDTVNVYDSVSFWVFAAALSGLSCLWGFIERRNKLFRQGMYRPDLGYERTGQIIMVSQGVVSILMVAMLGLAFWLFGWLIGLGAVFVSIVLAAMTS